MSTTRHDLEVIEKQGKERGLSGASPSENPHTGRANRAQAAAWHKGYVEGLAIREASA